MRKHFKITLLFFAALIIAPAVFFACNTQAKKVDGEPIACFEARYFAREKCEGAAAILADECKNTIRREWCVKILKEQPGLFRDFNDCWRQ